MPEEFKVEPVDAEVFSFRVLSDRTSERYLVDLLPFDYNGSCNCRDFEIMKLPKLELGGRGKLLMCKHLRYAREYAFDVIIRKLAKALNMEDVEHKEPSTEYGKARADFLKRNPRCAVYPNQRSIEPHHAFGKLGWLLMYVPLWVPVSRDGHNKIHSNPDWSRLQTWNGIPLLAPLGEWNNPKPERLDRKPLAHKLA